MISLVEYEISLVEYVISLVEYEISLVGEYHISLESDSKRPQKHAAAETATTAAAAAAAAAAAIAAAAAAAAGAAYTIVHNGGEGPKPGNSQRGGGPFDNSQNKDCKLCSPSPSVN